MRAVTMQGRLRLDFPELSLWSESLTGHVVALRMPRCVHVAGVMSCAAARWNPSTLDDDHDAGSVDVACWLGATDVQEGTLFFSFRYYFHIVFISFQFVWVVLLFALVGFPCSSA